MNDVRMRRTGELELGRVIQASWFVLRREAVLLLSVGAALVVLPTLAYGGLRVFGLVASPGDDILAAMRGAPGEMLVTSLLGTIYSGGAITVALARLEERPTSLEDMLGAGSRLFLPLLGINILTGLGIVLGLIVLIAPGLFLMTIWAVSSPARVAGGSGVWRALERSAELTRGQRWSVFGVVMLGCVAYLAVAVLGGMASAAADAYGPHGVAANGGLATELVLYPILQLFGVLLTTIVPAVLFHELKTIKEGPSTEVLADVFA